MSFMSMLFGRKRPAPDITQNLRRGDASEEHFAEMRARNQNATRIQSVMRGHAARQSEGGQAVKQALDARTARRRESAARLIQAAQRGHVGRQEARQLREEKAARVNHIAQTFKVKAQYAARKHARANYKASEAGKREERVQAMAYGMLSSSGTSWRHGVGGQKSTFNFSGASISAQQNLRAGVIGLANRIGGYASRSAQSLRDKHAEVEEARNFARDPARQRVVTESKRSNAEAELHGGRGALADAVGDQTDHAAMATGVAIDAAGGSGLGQTFGKAAVHVAGAAVFEAGKREHNTASHEHRDAAFDKAREPSPAERGTQYLKHRGEAMSAEISEDKRDKQLIKAGSSLLLGGVELHGAGEAVQDHAKKVLSGATTLATGVIDHKAQESGHSEASVRTNKATLFRDIDGRATALKHREATRIQAAIRGRQARKTPKTD